MTWTRKWLKLTFQSDWHIGSGAGIPGSVDRQVLRDEDGFPYVPGKTLTGILRDAAEWIAEVRGGQWKDALYGLFGNQPETHGGQEGTEARVAKIGVGSAEMDRDIRGYLLAFSHKGTETDLISPLFQVHPGVKIDPETGRTMDDHLFSTERVRRDCVLHAPVLLMDALSEDEAKLLDDAVKAVRHVGGKRRRGAGECNLAWDVDYREPQQREETPKPDFRRGPDGSVTLDIRLKTLQPVIVSRTTLGNEVRSDTEFPGSVFLSYYMEKVLAPLGEERLRRAVMNGEISISAFLPEFDGKTAMPVPLCLGELKEEKIPVNRLVAPPMGKKQIKDLRAGYVTASGEGMTYHSGGVQRVIRTHNTVDDTVQRPTEEVGGLFTYEAIRAGQTFRGTLRIGSALWDEIEKSPERETILSRLTHDRHTFGRSRKDEYGGAELTCVSVGAGEGLGGTALLDGRNGKAQGKYLVAYLLSDLLLRGEYQGYTVRLDDVKEALSKELGVELEDIPEEEWAEGEEDASISPLGGTRGHCVRAARRESWQRIWALPRPSLVFLKAGSVFMFKVNDPEHWDKNRAKALMDEGLGERRTEGYGRLLLNPPFLCGVNVARAAEEKPSSGAEMTLPEREEARAFILKLASDAARRSFRQTARREAYDIVNKGKDNAPFANYPDVRWGERPTASQFGALREAAAFLGKTAGMGIFRGWVQAVNRKDNREKKENPWKGPWRDMLGAMAENPEVLWGLRPAFVDFKSHFPEAFKTELEKLSESMLGVFLDLLCEAVFDEEKRKGQQERQEAGE